MINLAWGGFANGSVPDSALSPIDGQGHKLEHAAAAQFLAMQAAMQRDLGRTISVAPGSDSANRTLAQQQADYSLYQRGGNVAAYPGTSNHGWARAVDITGYEGNTRWISPTTGRSYYVNLPVWLWLQAHAADYGFHWATGDASGEGWHWESYNAPSATISTAAVTSTPINTTAPEEDMMKLYSSTSENGRCYLVTPFTCEPVDDSNYATQISILLNNGNPEAPKVNGDQINIFKAVAAAARARLVADVTRAIKG